MSFNTLSQISVKDLLVAYNEYVSKTSITQAQN